MAGFDGGWRSGGEWRIGWATAGDGGERATLQLACPPEEESK